ncbi:hypothetical protein GA0115255_124881, partial [Streptomyces sp. Ncost-T6T-2b]
MRQGRREDRAGLFVGEPAETLDAGQGDAPVRFAGG